MVMNFKVFLDFGHPFLIEVDFIQTFLKVVILQGKWLEMFQGKYKEQLISHLKCFKGSVFKNKFLLDFELQQKNNNSPKIETLIWLTFWFERLMIFEQGLQMKADRH